MRSPGPGEDPRLESPRDAQRSRLYAAEDDLTWGRELPTLEEVQAYVDGVVRSSVWAPLGGSRHGVLVRDGRGRRSACAQVAWHGGVVKFPRWARYELIVLHELAHLLVPPGSASHGAAFAGLYLDLVETLLPARASELLQAFGSHGVEVRRPARRDPDRRDPRRVLRLVQDLLALSRGTDSAAESANAAARAQRLLLEHNLSFSDVEGLEPAECDPLVEDRQPFSGQRRRIPSWKQMLLAAVAEGSLCEWVTNFYSENQPRTYSFIGRKSNVEVASYLYSCLERQVVELWEIEKKRLKKAGRSPGRLRVSFCEGVVEGVHRRLVAESRQFEASSNSSTAVVRARAAEARAHRRELYPRVTYTTTRIWLDPGARESGLRASDQLRFQAGLKQDGSPQRYLPGPGSSRGSS